MAEAVTVWRQSSADAIETDLAALWRETAREGPLSRALMANLILVQERDDSAGNAAAREALVGAVAQSHPVRAILLDYTPGIETPGAREAARVGLRTFGSSAARYGVELIAIRAACPATSMRSIVSRLTRGGVPTAVWWIDDLSRNPPPALMTTLGRQFLFDSASWRDPRQGFQVMAGILSRPHAPDIADLNWRRLAPIRRAIVHGLQSEPAALELRATGVEIRHAASRSAAALLLAGWLSGSLEWSSEDVPRIEESGDPADAFSTTLSGGSWAVRIWMDDHHVRVTGTTQTPFEILLPRETESECVAAELRSLGSDSVLHTAVRAAAVLAQ
jgi:glucose-6-phosphate dehydrogenase assembly protein OpcA